MNKEKNFKKIYEEYVDVRDKKIIELLKENKRLNDLLEGEHEVSQMYLNNIIKAIEYIENEMPCLWEVDDVWEDINGNYQHNYKEYDIQILLNKLKGVDKE